MAPRGVSHRTRSDTRVCHTRATCHNAATETVTSAVTPPASAETRTLERLIDVLQWELDAAREREIMLLQMLSQLQQQNQRLLDMPRSAPAASVDYEPQASRPLPPQRGDMRRRIIALLRDYPEGLSPAQTRQMLGVTKSLQSTMRTMLRDGLLQRVDYGRYSVMRPIS